jgi:colanic acid biosynthesis protein WcaH
MRYTPRHLDRQTFSHIVQYAPLVSIDLIVKDREGRILVGYRTNEPAKGYYFVPGGVIRKGETIERAFSRILSAETGCAAAFADARPLGVFEHFYDKNAFGDPGYGTHYVVLGYALQLDGSPAIVLDAQHRDCKWMDAMELLASPEVHEYTKTYFR